MASIWSSSCPFLTRSPSFTARCVTLPMMSALILTWVLGSILPGARTLEVMSSVRTRASWTGTPLRPPWAAMFTITRIKIRAAPRPIQSHFFFFMATRFLLGGALLGAAPDAIQLSLRDPNGRKGRNDVALGALQLNLGIDQVQDGRRADIVLLLRELQVLRRGLESAARDAFTRHRFAIRQHRLVHLALEIA